VRSAKPTAETKVNLMDCVSGHRWVRASAPLKEMKLDPTTALQMDYWWVLSLVCASVLSTGCVSVYASVRGSDLWSVHRRGSEKAFASVLRSAKLTAETKATLTDRVSGDCWVCVLAFLKGMKLDQTRVQPMDPWWVRRLDWSSALLTGCASAPVTGCTSVLSTGCVSGCQSVHGSALWSAPRRDS